MTSHAPFGTFKIRRGNSLSYPKTSLLKFAQLGAETSLNREAAIEVIPRELFFHYTLSIPTLNAATRSAGGTALFGAAIRVGAHPFFMFAMRGEIAVPVDEAVARLELRFRFFRRLYTKSDRNSRRFGKNSENFPRNKETYRF